MQTKPQVFIDIEERLPINREQETIHYLLTRKKDKIGDIAFDRLMAMEELS